MDTPKSLQALAAHQAAYQERLRQQPYYRMVQPIVEGFLRKIIDHGAFYLRVHTLLWKESWSQGTSRV